MAKSFRFPRWVEKTRTYSIHPVAFIDQPVATPHQPRYAQQLPPGGSQGGCAARVAKLATPTELKKFLAYSNQRTTPPQSDLSVPKCRQIRQLFNHGMIAPGNHNFERFAALCNTPEVEPRRLRRPGRQVGDPYRLRSFRFMSVSLPSGSGNCRVGTEFAASPEISGF